MKSNQIFCSSTVWMRLIILLWNEKACTARPWQSVLQLRIPASLTDHGSSTVAVVVPKNGTTASATTQSSSSSPYTTATNHPVASSSSSNTTFSTISFSSKQSASFMAPFWNSYPGLGTHQTSLHNTNPFTHLSQLYPEGYHPWPPVSSGSSGMKAFLGPWIFPRPPFPLDQTDPFLPQPGYTYPSSYEPSSLTGKERLPSSSASDTVYSNFPGRDHPLLRGEAHYIPDPESPTRNPPPLEPLSSNSGGGGSGSPEYGPSSVKRNIERDPAPSQERNPYYGHRSALPAPPSSVEHYQPSTTYDRHPSGAAAGSSDGYRSAGAAAADDWFNFQRYYRRMQLRYPEFGSFAGGLPPFPLLPAMMPMVGFGGVGPSPLLYGSRDGGIRSRMPGRGMGWPMIPIV
ncbi:hypothetical protein BV898_06413 [Hypsibius exemplaris]|uniref:Uncharacterized protein n=1 Tax=Hypsibius exemplaris TaxID=2072580 RepID=A0A1W0WWR3_HYPEX|nr:hypothetical protein BV898_06413 [Hypsibius exemplaris]